MCVNIRGLSMTTSRPQQKKHTLYFAAGVCSGNSEEMSSLAETRQPASICPRTNGPTDQTAASTVDVRTLPSCYNNMETTEENVITVCQNSVRQSGVSKHCCNFNSIFLKTGCLHVPRAPVKGTVQDGLMLCSQCNVLTQRSVTTATFMIKRDIFGQTYFYS